MRFSLCNFEEALCNILLQDLPDRGDVVRQFVDHRRSKIQKYINNMSKTYPVPALCTVEGSKGLFFFSFNVLDFGKFVITLHITSQFLRTSSTLAFQLWFKTSPSVFIGKLLLACLAW